MRNIFISITLILIFTNLHSQTLHPPQNPDILDPGIHDENVINTGNDIIEAYVCGDFESIWISVSDGDEAHVQTFSPTMAGYGNDLQTTTEIDKILQPNSDIIDPDVVLLPVYDPASQMWGVEAIIVYETIQGEINYKVHRFDCGEDKFVRTLIQGNLGRGSNPNIDISTSNENFPPRFAITWADKDNNIRNVVGEYVNNNYDFGPSVIIYDRAQNDGIKARTPDITISYLGLGGNFNPPHTWTVSTVFVNEVNQVFVHQESFINLYNGNANSNYLTPDINWVENILNRPRISSPDDGHGLAPYGQYDFHVVCDSIVGSPSNYNYYIWGWNQHFSTPSYYNYEFYQYPNIIEKEPVVDYSGDLIIISWTFENDDGFDIIQRQLGYSGNPISNDFSQVNMDVRGIQHIPSVAGDYSNGVLYTFYDSYDSHIKCKYNINTAYNLKGNTGKPLNIETLVVDNTLNTFSDEAVELRIFDLSGRLIHNSSLMNGKNNIDLNFLKKGVYISVYETPENKKAEKIIIL